ncbi:MAG: flagellar biosynthetic protein FliO, partial [Anaerolineae bacterium]|nr:flagellar biosynthetic protein FliO [Anaerolineae bacterium]
AAGPGGTTIRILETTGLAPGRSLHLVVVGEKTLLIGATEHQLSLLAEVSEASLPLPDEELLVSPDFEMALAASQPAAQATSEWQMTMNHLRSGLHHLRESVRR